MKPSPYQEVILDTLRDDTCNIAVQACAGSGKTTTLRLICENAPKTQGIVAICFAKINAEDFKKKLPPRVDCSTMHSLCFRIIKENVSGVTVDKEKPSRLITDMFGPMKSRDPDKRNRAYACEKFSAISVASMLNLKDQDGFEETMRFFLPDLSEKVRNWQESIDDVADYLKRTRADRRNISFDDMLDHVAHFKLSSSITYDLILGDEVQDWTKLQAAIAWQLAVGDRQKGPAPRSPLDDMLGLPGMQVPTLNRPTASRVILVGDRRQAIYGFRGADTKSMDILASTFQAKELPLSVCYRCPVSVVKEAQKIVGENFIKPREGAAEGEVINVPTNQFDTVFDQLPPGTLVISRTNTPLVKQALKCIVSGKKACVRGRDIGETLVKAIDRFSKTTQDPVKVLRHARKWYTKQVSKLYDQDRISPALNMMDQFFCLETVIRSSDSPSTARQRINSLFADDQSPGLTMSSIHKAKGLEEDVVAIIAPNKIPHPMVMKHGNADMVDQEYNMLYVAITRAMKTLYLMPVETSGRSSSADDIEGFIMSSELLEEQAQEADEIHDSFEKAKGDHIGALDTDVPEKGG